VALWIWLLTGLKVHICYWELAAWDPLNKIIWIQLSKDKDDLIRLTNAAYKKSKLPSREMFRSNIGKGSDWPRAYQLFYCLECHTGKLSWKYETKKKVLLKLRRLKISSVQWYKYKYLPVVRKIIKI